MGLIVPASKKRYNKGVLFKRKVIGDLDEVIREADGCYIITSGIMDYIVTLRLNIPNLFDEKEIALVDHYDDKIFPNGYIHEEYEDSVLIYRRDGTAIKLEDSLMLSAFIYVYSNVLSSNFVSVRDVIKELKDWFPKDFDEDYKELVAILTVTLLIATDLLSLEKPLKIEFISQ